MCESHGGRLSGSVAAVGSLPRILSTSQRLVPAWEVRPGTHPGDGQAGSLAVLPSSPSQLWVIRSLVSPTVRILDHLPAQLLKPNSSPFQPAFGNWEEVISKGSQSVTDLGAFPFLRVGPSLWSSLPTR